MGLRFERLHELVRSMPLGRHSDLKLAALLDSQEDSRPGSPHHVEGLWRAWQSAARLPVVLSLLGRILSSLDRRR